MQQANQNPKRTVGRRPKTGKAIHDTRAEILAAARRVFAQRGLNGTTVREVAQAAKVNNAMIYYHFKDKEDLYRSVLEDSFSAMMNIWKDPVFAGDTPVRSKIGKYVAGFIRFQKGNEELRRIMAMEFAASGSGCARICEQHFAKNFSRLTAIFKEGMQKGELKTFEPSLAAASLLGIVVHNFILQPMAKHLRGRSLNLNSKQFGDFVTELLFNGLSKNVRTTRKISFHSKKGAL